MASGNQNSEARHYEHESTPGKLGEGLLRVKGPEVDVTPLKEPITFAFSGRTAKNRFLKAPMTERLCRWNDESKGEDIVSQTCATSGSV